MLTDQKTKTRVPEVDDLLRKICNCTPRLRNDEWVHKKTCPAFFKSDLKENLQAIHERMMEREKYIEELENRLNTDKNTDGPYRLDLGYSYVTPSDLPQFENQFGEIVKNLAKIYGAKIFDYNDMSDVSGPINDDIIRRAQLVFVEGKGDLCLRHGEARRTCGVGYYEDILIFYTQESAVDFYNATHVILDMLYDMYYLGKKRGASLLQSLADGEITMDELNDKITRS